MYNVLIVDDDTLMRNALRAMISRFKNFQIIGEAANGAEAIAICRLYPVHLIFMDIIMPGMTGIEAGKKIKDFRGRFLLYRATYQRKNFFRTDYRRQHD